jgi:translation initiation factor 2 subunit 1
VLAVGDEVELRPGILGSTPRGEVTCTPLRTRVESLFSEGTPLQQALPGGLIGVGTALDAWLAKEDRLKGLVLGHVGTLPPIFSEITVKTSLMRRAAYNEVAGTDDQTKTKAATASAERRPQTADPAGSKAEKAEKLRSDEELLISAGASSCTGRVRAAKSGRASIKLDTPICVALGDTVALSRRRDGKWRLIGRADILTGCEVTPLPSVVDVSPHAAEASVKAQCPMESEAEQAANLDAQAPTEAMVDAKMLSGDEAAPRMEVGSRTQPSRIQPEASTVGSHDVDGRGDTTAQHTHVPITCRMRERLLPEVNEVVAVHVERVVDSEGVYVTLLEYDSAEAMIALSEISRKRKGQRALSATKATRVGTRDVCVVLRVDADKGYVDLSKWRVTDEERAACELQFKQSKAVQSIVRRVAETQGVSLVELYERGVWPLSRPNALNCHAHEAFVLATTQPDAIFNARFTPELPPHLQIALLDEICLRLRPSSTKLKAQLMVRCLGRAGCNAVRSALMEGVAVGQRHGLEISTKADVTPIYSLRATCAVQDKEAHLKTLAQVVEAVEKRIYKHA